MEELTPTEAGQVRDQRRVRRSFLCWLRLRAHWRCTRGLTRSSIDHATGWTSERRIAHAMRQSGAASVSGSTFSGAALR